MQCFYSVDLIRNIISAALFYGLNGIILIILSRGKGLIKQLINILYVNSMKYS